MLGKFNLDLTKHSRMKVSYNLLECHMLDIILIENLTGEEIIRLLFADFTINKT